MHTLVLLRHGESTWNQENRFTGWTDVGLTAKGEAEAHAAAASLKEGKYTFDCVYTSVLQRAIKTMWIVTQDMDLVWLPVFRAWQLNERHYGALQGLNKAETAAKFGEAQVKEWRRSYDIRPPALEKTDARWPGNDPRYRRLRADQVPTTECLKDTIVRVVPFWTSTIVPTIKAGERVLIVAHGNSLRALVKHLDGIGDQEIVELNIPTGVPLVYELNDDMKPIRHFYLGDPTDIAAKAAAVAAQGAAKQ